jgi:hypothetical protein
MDAFSAECCLSGHCIRELMSAPLVLPGLSGLFYNLFPTDDSPGPLSPSLRVSLRAYSIRYRLHALEPESLHLRNSRAYQA